MVSLFKKISIVATSVLLFATTAMPANNAEQVVFSTPGFVMDLTGNAKAESTPFGFWIWCAASAAPGSNGGYQHDNACQGSMYFYALDTHVTPVIGFVTEGSDGIYTMNIFEGTFAQLLHNTLHPAYTCQLTNTTPDPKGTGNGVEVTCQFLNPTLGGGTGSADVTNAVVNVTGP
jgi:hypothetical protein